MAEVALITLAKSVLQQLSSPALNEFLLLWNFKKELKKLESTVGTINDVLQDAEQRQSKDRLVQGWLVRLREVMYDADDLFDAVVAKALRKKAMAGNAFKKEVCLFFSMSNQLGFMFKISHEVKAIRERLDDIAKDISQFNFVSNRSGDQAFQVLARDETHSFVQVNDVIGRDQEKEEIIELLLFEDHRGEDTYRQKLSVIAMIGFGGLGKTTLAQFVYNDERVQRGFDLCLWACINYFSNLKEVLIGIITSIIGSKPHDSNLDQLQKMLRENIGRKKYLLVLDDVWDEDEGNWNKLKTLLDCGKSGSKVLVTTRSTRVAQRLGASKPYYDLKVMSEESAWSLFKKMAFKEGELDKNPELEPLGRQVVLKCGCVPLALVTIGRMLCYKEKEKMMWLRFVQNEIPEFVLDNEDNKIMQTLKISYSDLPPMLKHCFAYCSLFPKDYEFQKSKLVLLWQAQGFVVPDPKQSLEEAADAYFFYLVDRCFFQLQYRYYDMDKGCYECYCKMHDLLHDLAIQVAGMECKCFVDEAEAPNLMGEKRTLRHINALPSSSFDYSSLLSHSKTLKTLMCRADFNIEALNVILRRFRMLRTLDLYRMKIDKLPDSFGELFHLRYLNLACHSFEILPNSICKLYHLQTLMLHSCSSLKELPSDIGKLISLRHLFLKACSGLVSLPPGLGALTTLVTLDRLIVHRQYGGLRYLDQLDNLCGAVCVELPTEGWLNVVEDARKSNMSRKKRLHGMVLDWKESETNGALRMDKDEVKAVIEALEPHDNLQYLKISNYGGSTLPSWVFSHKNMKKLHLENFTLEYLVDMIRFNSLFPSLEILTIKKMPNLKGWWRQVASGENHRMLSLPCHSHVSEIVIWECPKLTEIMPVFGRTKNLNLRGANVQLVKEFITNCSSSLSSSPSESHYNNRLKVLMLINIEGLTCLPEDWTRHLTTLESLVITSCHELSWVSSGGLAHLTNLQYLEISSSGTDNRVVIDEELENGIGLPWKALQRLRSLTIPVGDKQLQRGLQYLTALESLKIETWEEEEEVAVDDHEERESDGMVWKGLKRLLRLSIGFGQKTAGFPKGIQYLCSLEDLKICDCKELRLSWTTIANMRLHSLNFTKVQEVLSVNEMVEEEQSPFTALVDLSIEDTKETKWIHHHIPWKLLSSLRCLDFCRVSNWSSLPDGIQHLTSLQRLTLNYCEGITALPNWIVNLKSLQALRIWTRSVELEKRCEAGTGEDWHLVSHIPQVYVTDWR